MAVPKKRTSMSKKRIRKNIWKKKTYFSMGFGVAGWVGRLF